MRATNIDNNRLLKAVQKLNLNIYAPISVVAENIYCTLRLTDTTPYNYDCIRLSAPWCKDFLIIDDGKKLHYRFDNGFLIKTNSKHTKETFKFNYIK